MEISSLSMPKQTQLLLEVSDEELQERKAQWNAPALKVSRGYLYKYARTVSSASEGCVTDEF